MEDKFFEEFYTKFYPYLDHRADTTEKSLRYLDSLKREKYLIVETGTTRDPGNLSSEGNSTVIFDLYCNHRNGTLYSVDLSDWSCSQARKVTSSKTIICLNDSVKFLNEFPNSEDIDLLYLDSLDVFWDNPHPSSLHHLKELAAVYAKLKPGCLIVVDDNADGVGKGQYVAEFLNDVGAELYFNEYQIGYIKR
jgi:hypothetical protein